MFFLPNSSPNASPYKEHVSLCCTLFLLPTSLNSWTNVLKFPYLWKNNVLLLNVLPDLDHTLPSPKISAVCLLLHVINYSTFRFGFCMVGADPGRRLCLCELVCLHKHTYMHAYTHSFVKLFCFHISLGDFPQTELFPCMHTLPDMKTELKNFHLQVMLIIKNTKGKKNPKPLPFYHCQNWTPTPSNHTTETHKSTQQISPFCPAFRPLCSFPDSVSDTNSDVWQKRDTADCPPAASRAAKWEMQAWKQARDSSQDSKARSIAEVTELSVVGRGWRGHSAATQHCLPYRHSSILRGDWGITAVFFFPIFPF